MLATFRSANEILERGPANAGQDSPYPGKCVCLPADRCGEKDVYTEQSNPGKCPGTSEVCCTKPSEKSTVVTRCQCVTLDRCKLETGVDAIAPSIHTNLTKANFINLS